jgi:large subunit ribosomal protein L2
MIKTIKTITSGYLDQSFESRKDLSKLRPPKSLLKKIKKSVGRDQFGHISSRHRGSGVKRLYRVISTLEKISDQQVKVVSIDYDPNRSARIALVELTNGIKKYIIAPENLKIDDVVKAGKNDDFEIGDRSRIGDIPVGSQISDVQIYPDSNKFFARAAGVCVTILAVEGEYALIKLPSGETRRVNINCYATIGQVSNSDHANIRIGKAGRTRKMNIRPHVRGKAMSPRSHPHGGGEGVNPIGLKYPKTPWGKVAIGKKTRGAKKSDKFIVKRAKER